MKFVFVILISLKRMVVKFLDNSILSAVIGIGGTILGFGLSEASNYFKRKEDAKERLLLSNLSLRQQAYAKLFEALSYYERYLYNFITHGNEFASQRDLEEFAPLEDLMSLMKVFESVEIWLHKETVDMFRDFFANSTILLNMSLLIHQESELVNTVDIAEASQKFIEEVGKLKRHLQKINGMPELDDYSNNMLKKP